MNNQGSPLEKVRIYFYTDYDDLYLSRKVYKDRIYLYIYKDGTQVCAITIVYDEKKVRKHA